MKFTSDPHTVAKTGGRLDKAESFVILDEPPFTPSDRASYDDSVALTPAPRNTIVGLPKQATFAIDVSLRRGRIALLTVVMVGVIVALVRFFQNGYEIRRYASKLDSAEQKQLLDDYNSYSGNIVSVFGKPIELFVTACVQVILLRFVSASMLRNEGSWKAVYAALTLTAGVGYLINNGFNSLNVQLVELELRPMVNASDLYLDETVTASSNQGASRVTNVTHSVSENQPSNPIANTVLRNLVESRAVRAKTVCEQNGTATMRKPFQMDTVEYGFPQRDWMKKLLPEALPLTTMGFLMNPTDTKAIAKLDPEKLPMNASIAADLTIYAVILSRDLIPVVGSMKDPTYNASLKGRTYNASAAVRVGLLPPDLLASDAVQRQWFVDHVDGYLTSAFNGSTWMTRTNIPTAFSHVQIAPNISFDAISLEVDLLPWTLQEFNNSKTGDRYMNGGVNVTSAKYTDFSFNCDPWPARCVFKKRDVVVSSPTVDNSELYMDAPSQVQAFSICLNDNGTEWMQSTRNGKFDAYLNIQPCMRTSANSMLLVSVGKRLSADALTQNTTADKSGIRVGGVGTATNIRKTYSITVGRLSWNTTDIAEAFGAKCNIAGGSKCDGLTIALNKTNLEDSPQQLVVSADNLPIDALLQPQLNNVENTHAFRQRPLTLVQVYEPTRQQTQELWYDIAAGDILYPHNVKNLTWDLTQKRPGDMCQFEEERVQRVLDNHRYIEYPLQATYTAAVFFLFQNAIVKDTVTVANRSINFTTLAFDGNTQPISLAVSIPFANALYTQLGCLVLVIGVVISLIWNTIVRKSNHRRDLLAGITQAEVMARVKLDDRSFPQLLLHRHVVLTSRTHAERRELDKFVIDSLSLREEREGVDHDKPSHDTEAEDHTRVSVVV